MTLQQYTQNLNTRFITGISREHSYRADLQNLLTALLPDVLVTNEPARIECGAPDYIITRKDIPVGYFEPRFCGFCRSLLKGSWPDSKPYSYRLFFRLKGFI